MVACDVSWKAKLSILHDENVLLKQSNWSLLTIEQRKSMMNTKVYDKSETLRQLLCVTPFNKNLETKAKNVSNTKVTTDRPNPVTLQSTSTIEKKQQHNANVNARGMYKINQQDTNIPDSKANTNVSIFIGVDSSNSVKRPKSKDNKSKNSVLKNTKDSSTNVPTRQMGSQNRLTPPSALFHVIDSDPALFVDYHNHKGYGDYVQGNLTIYHVNYVEGLGHNLFSVGQFCDGDLENSMVEAKLLACFTQNRSIVHTRHNKTLYELIRDRKPNVQYFHVFGSLCYPTNNRDDLGKMKPKADIGIFVGYSESSCVILWTKNHPLEQVIGDPSKPVMTRKRLQTDAEVCMYALTVSTIEPKNIKEAMLDHSWIESMQENVLMFGNLLNVLFA
ncbi:retrovirus-related pol polyprotein from transposon TNT 1-94 [Tanacetum coccineum]